MGKSRVIVKAGIPLAGSHFAEERTDGI